MVRSFYLEHPAVRALTEEAADEIREALQIQVYGRGCPKPVSSFVHASLPQYILDTLQQVDFREPTAIQRQAWPVALSGLDLVAVAETGSGKTLAYLLPALVHVNAEPIPQPGDGPLAIILAPTRELAMQIHEEIVRYGHPSGIRAACIVGGLDKQTQVQQLRKAPEIVVATPGRLNDLVSARRTNLTRCTYLVLDEADRMLDLGFEPQVHALLVQMSTDRQTLLFSATWPEDVQALAQGVLLPDAVTVEVGGALTHGGKANARIEQRIAVCQTDAAKMPALMQLLEEVLSEQAYALIFCSSKRRCEDLTRALRVDGWPALAIHGDKLQDERDWVLQEFRLGSCPLLVATDVAQRGLDIKNVRFVINYDAPGSAEAYVHRIGRTARAGNFGCAHTFVLPDEARVARDLMDVLNGAAQPVSDELAQLAATYKGR